MPAETVFAVKLHVMKLRKQSGDSRSIGFDSRGAPGLNSNSGLMRTDLKLTATASTQYEGEWYHSHSRADPHPLVLAGGLIRTRVLRN